jgi:hypothetical protein
MSNTPIDPDYVAAYALAQQARDKEHHRLLVKATGAALGAKVSDMKLAEVEQLVAYWKSMPEHITGGTAIHQLEAVLLGGRAPRNASVSR